MINNFASLQHIHQLAFQAAWGTLSENLRSCRDSYETKAEFVAFADYICNQFPDEASGITPEDNEAIAAKVWDYYND